MRSKSSFKSNLNADNMSEEYDYDNNLKNNSHHKFYTRPVSNCCVTNSIIMLALTHTVH